MPSLQDVANQIKDDLDQIKTSVALTANRVDLETQHLDAGVSTLANGLFAILEVDKASSVLLADNVAQNQTIICWLQKQADLQCQILRRLEALVEIETATRAAVSKLERIYELVHARETLEVDRLDAAEAKIERCCPPDKTEPKPCFEPCPAPQIDRYQPKGQDWQPPKGK